MRANLDNKSVDIEVRDINYVLTAYVWSYQFHSKNEAPEKIIFPLLPSIKVHNAEIPIEYVPPTDPIAIEIARDGANIAEVTPKQEAVLDEKDEEIRRLKADLERLQVQGIQTIPKQPETPIEVPPTSPAKTAFAKAAEERIELVSLYVDPDRTPRQPPGGDIGPGLGPSGMQARDPRDSARTKRDLVDEPEIDEPAEKEYDKKIGRNGDGRPVIED